MAYGNIVLGLEGPGNICLVSDKIIIDDGGRGAIRGKTYGRWKSEVGVKSIAHGSISVNYERIATGKNPLDEQMSFEKIVVPGRNVIDQRSATLMKVGGHNSDYYEYNGSYMASPEDVTIVEDEDGFHGAKITDLKIIGFRNIGDYVVTKGPYDIESIFDPPTDGIKKITPVISYKSARYDIVVENGLSAKDGVYDYNEADVVSTFCFYSGGSYFPWNHGAEGYGKIISHGYNLPDKTTAFAMGYGEFNFTNGYVDLSDNSRYPSVNCVSVPTYQIVSFSKEGEEKEYGVVGTGTGVEAWIPLSLESGTPPKYKRWDMPESWEGVCSLEVFSREAYLYVTPSRVDCARYRRNAPTDRELTYNNGNPEYGPFPQVFRFTDSNPLLLAGRISYNGIT